MSTDGGIKDADTDHANYRGLMLRNLYPATDTNQFIRLDQSIYHGQNEDIVARCTEDDEILQQLGITYEFLAEQVSSVIRPHENTFRITTPTGNTVIWSGEITKGMIYCPGEDYEDTFCLDATIRNEQTGMRMTNISNLHEHLLREHHFLEGRGSSFRFEPLDFILTMDIPIDENVLKDVVGSELQRLGEPSGIEISRAHNILLFASNYGDISGIMILSRAKARGF